MKISVKIKFNFHSILKTGYPYILMYKGFLLVLLVFSIGTPFCICCYCSLRCINSYLKAIQNAEIQANSEDFESESESDSESENGYHREDETAEE